MKLYIEESRLEELRGELRQMLSAIVIPNKRTWRWIAGELAKIDALIGKYTFSEVDAEKQGIDMDYALAMSDVYDDGNEDINEIVRDMLSCILPESCEETSYSGDSVQFLACYQDEIGAIGDDPDELLSKAGQRAFWRLTLIREFLSSRNVRDASAEEIAGWWRVVGESVEGLFFVGDDEVFHKIDGSYKLWELFKDVCDELDCLNVGYVFWEQKYWFEHFDYKVDERGKIPMSIFEHIIEDLEEKYGSEDKEDEEDDDDE